MKIHKDKIVFREPHLQTEEGRMSQTKNPRWQALKKDIEKTNLHTQSTCCAIAIF